MSHTSNRNTLLPGRHRQKPRYLQERAYNASADQPENKLRVPKKVVSAIFALSI